MLFSKSQGGKSIVLDECLLRNVCALTKPYSLAGIDGSIATRLKVNRCGTFREKSASSCLLPSLCRLSTLCTYVRLCSYRALHRNSCCSLCTPHVQISICKHPIKIIVGYGHSSVLFSLLAAML
jgi:hypothetical protein